MPDIHKHSSACLASAKTRFLYNVQYLHKRQILTSFPLNTKLLFQSPPESKKLSLSCISLERKLFSVSRSKASFKEKCHRIKYFTYLLTNHIFLSQIEKKWMRDGPVAKSSERRTFPLLLQSSMTGSTPRSTPAIHQIEFNWTPTNTTLLHIFLIQF